jgi:ABC-type phosphate transport system auxiliary subunit
MTLEELQDLVEKDLKIDDTELDIESLKTPQLHNKYLKLLSRFNLLLKKTDSDYAVLHRNKWEYYMGKSDPKVYREKPFDLKILRTDIDKYLLADEEIIKQSQKISYLQIIVNHLEQVLRQINNRTFQIKNAIDWKKFTSGGI